MKNAVSREELIPIGVAHAISRSEKLEGFNGLSILMEYREWVCDDPSNYNVLSAPYLAECNLTDDFFHSST